MKRGDRDRAVAATRNCTCVFPDRRHRPSGRRNDSDEARHALDWTIENVLKEEDSLVLIYSVLSHHDHHEDHQHGEKKPSCDSALISKGWQTLLPYQQQCKSAGIMVSSSQTNQKNEVHIIFFKKKAFPHVF